MGHAQDLVQSALLAVYVRSRRRRPDSPEAYVRKAILNTFLSGKRRRTVTEQLVERLPEAGSPPEVSRYEQQEAVSALVVGLTPRQRAVLFLRYYEDWSEEQIAAALGVSAGTVKSLASRGLATLRAAAIPEGSGS
jgi:RNA polymerase sigma-70 factor (sigma-E family)